MQTLNTIIAAMTGIFSFIKACYAAGYRGENYDVCFASRDCSPMPERQSGTVARIVASANSAYGLGWRYYREYLPNHPKEFTANLREFVEVRKGIVPSPVIKVFAVERDLDLGGAEYFVENFGCVLEVYKGITDELMLVVTPLGKFTP